MNAQRAIAPILLLLCLLLGGASAAGLGANLLLQLIAVAILGFAFFAEPSAPATRPVRQLMVLVALAIAMVAMQLVPLPPALWTSLPGREAVAEGYSLLGMELPWLPVSLAPRATLASALWLLPALALLVAMLRLEPPAPAVFAWILIAISAASAAVGALQAASGEASSWYFYAISSFGVGIGFFANANHLATLLVATIPFVAALYVHADRSKRSSRRTPMGIVALGALAILAVGLIFNGSLAGVGLAVPVLAASLGLILFRRRAAPVWSFALLALLLAGSVAVAFSAPFGNNLTGEAAVSEDSRATAFSRSIPAAGDFLPMGSGIGTFPRIYPSLEDPAGVDPFYMNHVHGDYIELVLETGLPGLLLLALFLAWWTERLFAIWRSKEPHPFARAATIASAAMLAHSIVDYPLRTAALSSLFALCCALMAEPRPGTRGGAQTAVSGARHLSADQL